MSIRFSSKACVIAASAVSMMLISGCATETHREIAPQQVETYRSAYNGVKTTLAIGNFDNRSSYMQGMFSSGDKLGTQAKTILKTHLQQTNRFRVVDRDNMQQLANEAKLRGQSQKLKGARYVVSGDVTEFGRKVTGDQQLFGLLGSGKTQTAYAKVSLNIVDIETSEIVYSTQGAGEYQLSNREVVGFGGSAGYDATLNGKVLNFAIKAAVNNLAHDVSLGVWTVEK